MRRYLRIALAATVMAWMIPAHISAHDVPTDVRLQMFVKPEGQTLRLLVRVPLTSINDIPWPELQPGVLDISRADSALREATSTALADLLEVYEGDHLLAPRIAAVRASIPADRSFEVYEQALAHITAPPRPEEVEVFVAQGLLDAILEYPIASDRSAFSIRPNVRHLGLQVLTVLRFLPPERPERVLLIHDDPGRIHLDPNWWQAVWLFFVEGFSHIIDGIDHLLFLLCLVIPFRRFRLLVPIVTGFTIAHAITLIASAFDMAPDALWLPPLVETLIAVSLVYIALENVVSPALARRWVIAFGFGLAHGFGYAVAMRDTLQFAGSHLVSSLLSFNVGIQIAQLIVLLLIIPAVDVLFRVAVAERVGTIVLSAFVAHTSWHWLLERGGRLILYRFQWPVFDAAFFALLLQWMMIVVALAGVAWLVFGVFGMRLTPDKHEAAAPASDARP